ncbi:hypothetical protein EV360DRAFT_73442 [Lentinula raphanica]|nr:hypothetical protein EV360DRAFT_73442 [Lentinula raphanica]
MILSRLQLSILIAAVGMIPVLGLPVPDENDLSALPPTIQARASQDSSSGSTSRTTALLTCLEPQWDTNCREEYSKYIFMSCRISWDLSLFRICNAEPTDEDKIEKIEQTKSLLNYESSTKREVQLLQIRLISLISDVRRNDVDPQKKKLLNEYFVYAQLAGTDKLKKQIEYYKRTAWKGKTKAQTAKDRRRIGRLERKWLEVGDMTGIGLADENGVGFYSGGYTPEGVTLNPIHPATDSTIGGRSKPLLPTLNQDSERTKFTNQNHSCTIIIAEKLPHMVSHIATDDTSKRLWSTDHMSSTSKAHGYMEQARTASLGE